MLYERDFRKLTDEEIAEWKSAEEFYENSTDKIGGITITGEHLIQYYKRLPLAVVHHRELFPNNFLNTDCFENIKKINSKIQDYKALIERDTTTERDVLNFIREKQAYFIIASIMTGFGYNFGHHKAFIFKEFELPPNYIVDFLIVGKNSGGFEFIFVELESVYGQIINKDGDYGTNIRKGLNQINDWDSWIDSNYSTLKLVYDKYLGTIEQLPREFMELDKSRIHYVVVVGRRKDYTRKTYQLRRKLLKTSNIQLLHYDNLIDSSEFLVVKKNF